MNNQANFIIVAYNIEDKAMAVESDKLVDNMIGRVFRDCRIKEKIAVGGFGTVYKGFDDKLKVYRAIKIFHQHLSQEPNFRKRFEIEMRLLANIDHPNIVRIIGAIDEPDISGFIMEYIEGDTLSNITEKKGAFPISQSLDIFIQIARAIAYAHNLDNPVIHRDLSPDNVMLRPDGVVKIMDFGIAKTIGSERVTQTGIVLGKPHYMAPEQFEGMVSIYTDQYALGVILYEMVTGKLPFDAESPIALYKLHLNSPVPSAREINSQVPMTVEKVIIKAMSKDEKDRFKSVDEMVKALLGEGQDSRAVDNKIANLIFKANKSIERQEFSQAQQILEEVLSYEPDNKEVLVKIEELTKLKKQYDDQNTIEECFHQAQEFSKSQMKEEACRSVVDFLKISQPYNNSRIVKEYHAKLQSKMPEIYKDAVQIVQSDWQKIDQYVRKGKVLFQKDSYSEALDQFLAALKIDPHNETVQKLKVLTEKKIKMEQIANFYKEGILAIKNENFQKALECFDEVLKANPQHSAAKQYRNMAITEIEKRAKNRSEVDSVYREALALYEKWEFTLAIEKFERVLELDQAHDQAKNLLTESRSRVADENKIEEIGFFYNQGITFYKSQQWEKSITCFNRVLKYMESHKGAIEHKRMAEEKMEQQKGIQSLFEQALELFRNSQYNQALPILNQILSQDKNHKGALQYKALCDELQKISNDTPENSQSENPFSQNLSSQTSPANIDISKTSQYTVRKKQGTMEIKTASQEDEGRK